MIPLDVVMECLSLREQRVSTDLVRDEVEGELHKVTGMGVGLHRQTTMFSLWSLHMMSYVQTFDK